MLCYNIIILEKFNLIKKSKKSPKIKLSLGRKIRIFLFVVLSLLLQYIVLMSVLSSKRNEKILETEVYARNIISNLTYSVQQTITSSQILKNMYLVDNQYVINNFESICERFIEDDITIGSMYIAPEGIIQCCYPKKLYKSTVGFNMMEDPVQGDKARFTRDSGKITICGPYNLIEGGLGLITRNPIYVDGEFVAFSIIVLDLQTYINKTKEAFNIDGNMYNYGLWKDYDPNIITDNDGFFLKNTSSAISKTIDIPFVVLNDTWHISIEPKGGWESIISIKHEIALTSLLVLIFISLVIFYHYYAETRVYTLEHDSLTGLFTRSAVYRRVNKLFKEYPDREYDVLVADIRNFKMINGIHGNKKCDELLCYLAEQYSKEVRESVCGRYGGDIFILFFPSMYNNGAEYFINRTKEILRNAPIKNITIKYGFYKHVDKSVPVNLISDRALMAAKSIANNYDYIFASYDGDVSKQHEKEQFMESNFEAALKNGEFKVWFQPKYDLKTETLCGAEALVRWIKPDGSVISPADFIHVFEEDGLIVHLDEYVFKTVCNQIKFWYDQNTKILPISINLSRTTLHHEGIIDKYKNILLDSGIPIDCISLEITESATFSDKSLVNLVKELQNAGFTLDMDDFGTGSSSLSSLNIFPFNVIKIDKSLIDYIGTKDGEELLRLTINLLHFKKLKVIAEGVEYKNQIDFLKSLDCDIVQGFYYSKPLPYDQWIEKIIEFYKENKKEE